MTVKEFIELIENASDREIRFHTSDKSDMEFLSSYISDDGKYLEVDVGNDGE